MLKLSPRKYRIQLKKQSQLENTSKAVKEQQLVGLTKQILRQGKFMYIDINQQEGFKLMNQCESSDDDEEIDKISNKYVVNLNDLTSPTSKNINYIYKIQQQHKKRKRALTILRDSLEKSSQRLEQLRKPGMDSTRYQFMNNRTISVHKQVGYQHLVMPTETQFDRKMNSRLYRSFHKNLTSPLKSSTIQTQRSLRQNRKQIDDVHMSSQRLKMILPQIKRGKKKIVY